MIEFSKAQSSIYTDNSRFILAVCGRRFGKTEVAVYKLLTAATVPNSNIAYIAPTYNQAKRIVWKRLKDRIPKQWLARDPVETSPQTLYLKNNSTISVHGAANIDNLRGEGFDFVVLDETSEMKSEVWFEVLRPALSDRQGKALLIGTPKGFNWVYDMSKNPEFSFHQYTTIDGGRVTADEVESAKNQLDERTFKQEYEATFETATGLVYYAYGQHNHKDIKFNPSANTHLCWDFNVNPMSCIINQEQPDGTWCFVKEFSHKDSNTEYTAMSVERFLKSQNFNGELSVTGDSSGGSHKSSASMSDWEIIERIFKNYRGYNRRVRRTKRIIDRVTALNSVLRAYDGTIKQYVNPAECPVLVNDFNRVLWKANGEQLDDANGKLTHMSDAASYDAYNFHYAEKTYEIGRIQ